MNRTAAQRGRANRRQGRETERAVRDYLRTWWPELDYLHAGGPSRTHTDERGDLGPLVDSYGDHITVEVKGWRATQPMGAIEAAAREAADEAEAAGKGGCWVLIVRRPGCADVGQWFVYLPLSELAAAMGHLFGIGVAAPPNDLAQITVRAWVALVAPEQAS